MCKDSIASGKSWVEDYIRHHGRLTSTQLYGGIPGSRHLTLDFPAELEAPKHVVLKHYR